MRNTGSALTISAFSNSNLNSYPFTVFGEKGISALQIGNPFLPTFSVTLQFGNTSAEWCNVSLPVQAAVQNSRGLNNIRITGLPRVRQ